LLGVGGPCVGGLGVGGLDLKGLGVGGLDLGGLGVGMGLVNSSQRGMLRAMALHVKKSVGRSLRFNAFLSLRPNFISGYPIDRVCVF
jgi:hypothetical protein